jgi:DNA gyrase inhibitor GyrI
MDFFVLLMYANNQSSSSVRASAVVEKKKTAQGKIECVSATKIAGGNYERIHHYGPLGNLRVQWRRLIRVCLKQIVTTNSLQQHITTRILEGVEW